uniref:Putative fatty acid beta hydroxylase n=1 Tax=Arthrobacter sp. AK-1 TaxID=415095 RepID=A6YFN8_9MICC|nr:cytochrome P450 [Arthrobacter sp. AK-1]ABR67042.1 putative fatty acid beta hydroxylase [Arthrobacter sp. AK-1]
MTVQLPDSSLALLREGYTFISSRCDRLGTDLFRTTLILRPVVCLRGAEAAEFFYGGGRFGRKAAMPRSAQHLLQDAGSVQSLQGSAHRRRKQLFLDLMTNESVERLGRAFDTEWHSARERWQDSGEVVLHDEVRRVLTATACHWAGVSADRATVSRRARELSLMIDKAGAVGPVNWYARWRRRSTEKWAGECISSIRRNGPAAASGSPAAVIAFHTDEHGNPLSAEVAAVELLNLLRPIVAVSRFMVFAAVALQQHPEWNDIVRKGQDADLDCFAQEVRRYYPFFPFVGGTARETLEWKGHTFKTGQWALFDLYGTNHDGRLWKDPESFNPARFRVWRPDPHTLVPQGAGDAAVGHRCPGEDITVDLIRRATRALAAESGISVPAQDLSIDLTRMPALPRSGFILSVGRASD